MTPIEEVMLGAGYFDFVQKSTAIGTAFDKLEFLSKAWPADYQPC